jgi:hypothetical protein
MCVFTVCGHWNLSPIAEIDNRAFVHRNKYGILGMDLLSLLGLSNDVACSCTTSRVGVQEGNGNKSVDRMTQPKKVWTLLIRTEVVHLTPTEFELLALMMRNQGVPVTHAKLLRSVWGPEYGTELDYLRSFVKTLRQKLKRIPPNQNT